MGGRDARAPTIRVRLPVHEDHLPHRHLAARRRRPGHARPRLRSVSPRSWTLRARCHDGRLRADRAAGAGRLGDARASVRRALPACRCQGFPARASGRRRLCNRDVCRRGGRVDRQAARRKARQRPGLRARVALRPLPRARRGIRARPGRTARGAAPAARPLARPGQADRRAEPLPRRACDRLGCSTPRRSRCSSTRRRRRSRCSPSRSGLARSSSPAASHRRRRCRSCSTRWRSFPTPS